MCSWEDIIKLAPLFREMAVIPPKFRHPKHVCLGNAVVSK